MPSVHRIQLSDFSLIQSASLETTCTASATGSMALEATAGVVYVACQMQSSAVVKVQLSDLPVVQQEAAEKHWQCT
jgi:hypothetical protein